MKVLLVSCSQFYNLGLNKIKQYHLQRGDTVFEDTSIHLFTPKVDKIYISAIFSWDIPKMIDNAILAKTITKNIELGGVSTTYLSNYVEQQTGLKVSKGIDERFEHVRIPNPRMTFTSRGCIRNCEFCIVNKIERFCEYDDFDVAPLIQDNNFLATSKKHREKVYEKLKGVNGIDFNQALDARLFNKWDLDQMRGLKMKYFRFAFDHLGEENALVNAVSLLRCTIPDLDWRRIPVYVLYGYKDTFEEAQYRANLVWELGGHPFCMPYKELNQLTKEQPKSSIQNWPPRLYIEFARFHNRVKMFAGGKGNIYEYLEKKGIEWNK